MAALAASLCVWDSSAWNYRAIFSWVTSHISYDKQLLQLLETDPAARRRTAPMEPQDVLDERTAVCQGYAELTVALCLLCEIP